MQANQTSFVVEESQMSFGRHIHVVLQDGPANCTVIVGLVRVPLGFLVSGLWCSAVT